MVIFLSPFTNPAGRPIDAVSQNVTNPFPVNKKTVTLKMIIAYDSIKLP